MNARRVLTPITALLAVCLGAYTVSAGSFGPAQGGGGAQGGSGGGGGGGGGSTVTTVAPLTGTAATAGGTNAFAVGVHAQANTTDSLAVGTSSEANGANATALGEGTQALAANATALGQATTVSNANGTGIGYDVSISANGATVVGASSSSSGSDAVVLGQLSSANATGAIAIGQNVLSSAGGGIAVGQNANQTGGSVVLGIDANDAGFLGVALGSNALLSASGQFVVGSSAAPSTDIYFGKGAASSSPIAWTIHGTGGFGSNVSAVSSVSLAGSQGTGTGTGGSVLIQIAPAGSSGSSLNALVTAVTVYGADGGVTVGAPTGGDQGVGTLNAAGLYVNGVAVSAGGGTTIDKLNVYFTSNFSLVSNNATVDLPWDTNGTITGTGLSHSTTVNPTFVTCNHNGILFVTVTGDLTASGALGFFANHYNSSAAKVTTALASPAWAVSNATAATQYMTWSFSFPVTAGDYVILYGDSVGSGSVSLSGLVGGIPATFADFTLLETS